MKPMMLYAVLAALTPILPAQAAYRCTEAGKTVYQDAPCEGEGRKVDTTGGINYKPSNAPRQHSRSTSTREVSPPATGAPGKSAATHADAIPPKSKAKAGHTEENK